MGGKERCKPQKGKINKLATFWKINKWTENYNIM